MTQSKDDDAVKAEKQPRRTFCVYFYGDELERVRAFAKAQGISMTKLIRQCTLDAMDSA